MPKLKSINKQPSFLSSDRFYAMAQEAILKASPEAICLGGVFVVGGLLASLGINDNKFISGVPNYIPIPSKLWYVVKKSLEATFMGIAGFVCKYPCTMS